MNTFCCFCRKPCIGHSNLGEKTLLKNKMDTELEQVFLHHYDQQPKDCQCMVHRLKTQILKGGRGRPGVPPSWSGGEPPRGMQHFPLPTVCVHPPPFCNFWANICCCLLRSQKAQTLFALGYQQPITGRYLCIWKTAVLKI